MRKKAKFNANWLAYAILICTGANVFELVCGRVEAVGDAQLAQHTRCFRVQGGNQPIRDIGCCDIFYVAGAEGLPSQFVNGG